MFNLFYLYVLSVLNYGAEVWGYINSENTERVHKKFWKWILNVKQSTHTLALYSELGRFPLYIERHVQMVKYFLMINTVKSENCILKAVLQDHIKCLELNESIKNCVSYIRDILEKLTISLVNTYNAELTQLVNITPLDVKENFLKNR
jgi:hypothetical protein